MMIGPVWALLAFAIWTIAVLMFGIGVLRWSKILTGRAKLRDFPGDEPHGSEFYRRISRAHANCVENLPVFGAIVVSAVAAGAASPLMNALSAGVVVARICQTAVHVASGANAAIAVRFAFFALQLAAFVSMAVVIVAKATA
jgi:uncharacterized MAPEG superfamily protein